MRKIKLHIKCPPNLRKRHTSPDQPGHRKFHSHTKSNSSRKGSDGWKSGDNVPTITPK